MQRSVKRSAVRVRWEFSDTPYIACIGCFDTVFLQSFRRSQKPLHIPAAHTAMQDSAERVVCLRCKNPQMYLVFRTVRTQLLCIVDCRIGTVQQRPALLPNHIGNLPEPCAKFFLLLRQRFRFEPLHVFWPRIMEYQIDQEAKRVRCVPVCCK